MCHLQLHFEDFGEFIFQLLDCSHEQLDTHSKTTVYSFNFNLHVVLKKLEK